MFHLHLRISLVMPEATSKQENTIFSCVTTFAEPQCGLLVNKDKLNLTV